MQFSDFEYNGKRLSHFNCTLGFVDSSSDDAVAIRSPLELNTFIQNGSNKSRISNTNYKDPLIVTFNIVKANCYDEEDIYIDDHELTQMMDWLDTKKYQELKVYYDDGSFYDVVFYAVLTESSSIRVGEGIAGLTLTFSTNAPYGFTEPIVTRKNLQANEDFMIHPDSHEIGILLPKSFVITLNNTPPNGKLIVQNDQDAEQTEIANCANGEVITLDCQNKLISTTNTRDTFHKDFNYNYPRLIIKRDVLNVQPNTFKSNTACEIKVEYQGVRKVGVVV